MIKIYVKVEDLLPTEIEDADPDIAWDPKRQEWYASMDREGIKEPIAIDSNGIILDGNFRYFFARRTELLTKQTQYLWVDPEYLQVSDNNQHLITRIKELRKQLKELNRAYRSYRTRQPVDPPKR